MSKVTGLLNFIAQAPGQVFGGLLGPSPLPPGLAGQLPPGYEEQARQQAIQQMAISALSAPRGQQLAQATQAGQTGYRSSLVDMLRMREMERMQGEREKEEASLGRLRGRNPQFADLSRPTIEQIVAAGMKPRDAARYERGLTKEEATALGLPGLPAGKVYVGEFQEGASRPFEIKTIGSAVGEGDGGSNLREIKIQDAMGTFGITRQEAVKLVDNFVSITNPDAAGRVYRIDEVTGNGQVVGGPPNATAGSQVVLRAQELRRDLEPISGLDARKAAKAIEDGDVGLASAFQNFVGKALSPLGVEVFVNNAQNRNSLRIFTNSVKKVLAVNAQNGRIAVQEQQDIEAMLDDLSPDTFFTNPARARVVYANIMDRLNKLDQKAAEILGEAPAQNDLQQQAAEELRRRGIK